MFQRDGARSIQRFIIRALDEAGGSQTHSDLEGDDGQSCTRNLLWLDQPQPQRENGGIHGNIRQQQNSRVGEALLSGPPMLDLAADASCLYFFYEKKRKQGTEGRQ